jgi:transposase-like protein
MSGMIMTTVDELEHEKTSEKKRRRTYSGSFKAKVVTDWILGKRSLSDLAEQYQIHPNQIKNWKSMLLKNAHLVLGDRRRSS